MHPFTIALSFAVFIGIAVALDDANAQSECLSIQNDSSRLACYDRALKTPVGQPATTPLMPSAPLSGVKACATNYPKPQTCDVMWSAQFDQWQAHCARVVMLAIDKPHDREEDLDRIQCMIEHQTDAGKRLLPIGLKITRSHRKSYRTDAIETTVYETVLEHRNDRLCPGKVRMAVDGTVVEDDYVVTLERSTTIPHQLNALTAGKEAVVDVGGHWPRCAQGRRTYDLAGFGQAVEATRAKFYELEPF